jgi:hypothetical protein
VELANEMLRERWGAAPASGPAFLAACIAPCSNAWRFILNGGLLLKPIAPPKRADPAPEVSIYVQDRASGEMVRAVAGAARR